MSRRSLRDKGAAAGGDAMEAIHQRHQALMRVYQRSAKQQRHSAGSSTEHAASELDLVTLQRHFQFIRDDDADLERGSRDWEVRMSVRYYRQLFREYALADLTRYREGKVGLRWRTEMEVVAGKGQFICGNKHCDERVQLHSYELLFAYIEQGETKRCLVKVRVCELCARKLFYRKLKEAEERESADAARRKRKKDSVNRKRDGKRRKRRRSESTASESSNSSSCEEDAGDDDRPSASIHDVCAKINASDARKQRLSGGHNERSKDNMDGDEEHELRRLMV